MVVRTLTFMVMHECLPIRLTTGLLIRAMPPWGIRAIIRQAAFI
jgi:hypothetical protein